MNNSLFGLVYNRQDYPSPLQTNVVTGLKLKLHLNKCHYHSCAAKIRSRSNTCCLMFYKASFIKCSHFYVMIALKSSTLIFTQLLLFAQYILISSTSSITFFKEWPWSFYNTLSGSSPNSRTLHSDFAKSWLLVLPLNPLSCYSLPL